jgi:ATP-dependent protease ClpP protease subunit
MQNRFYASESELEDIECEESSSQDLLYVLNNHIYFYQEINKTSALIFNKVLTEVYFTLCHTMLSSGLSKPQIHIHFNSPGGELFSSLSMLKTVESVKRGIEPLIVPTEVITHIDGESSSGSSIISIAGTKRLIGEYSCILIHNAFSGMSGRPENFEDHITNTKMLVDSMKDIYKKYTKLTDENLDEMLKHDKYINATECLELGLADAIE